MIPCPSFKMFPKNLSTKWKRYLDELNSMSLYGTHRNFNAQFTKWLHDSLTITYGSSTEEDWFASGGILENGYRFGAASINMSHKIIASLSSLREAGDSPPRSSSDGIDTMIGATIFASVEVWQVAEAVGFQSYWDSQHMAYRGSGEANSELVQGRRLCALLFG